MTGNFFIFFIYSNYSILLITRTGGSETVRIRDGISKSA